MPRKNTTYRRTQLYEEVWTQPVRTVAKQYGVSDVALAKICRKLAIPLPGRGYWARKSSGQNTERIPLPPKPEGVSEEMSVSRWQDERPPLEASSPRVQATVAREKTPEAAIIVSDVLDEPHKLIATARRILSRAKPNVDGFVDSGRERCLNISVSPA